MRVYTLTIPGRFTVNQLLDFEKQKPTITAEVAVKLQQDDMIKDIEYIYRTKYAVPLYDFIEAAWYLDDGPRHLAADRETLELFAFWLDTVRSIDLANPQAVNQSRAFEMRVVWQLASMIKSAAAAQCVAVQSSSTQTGVSQSLEAVLEAAYRLEIVANLICGNVAPNPLKHSTTSARGPEELRRIREYEFWFQLGNFVSLCDDGPTFAADMDITMTLLRQLLDGRENRDVLYSAVVLRALGERVPRYTDADRPDFYDEKSARQRVDVARRFIKQHKLNGTTPVVRTVCGLICGTLVSMPTSGFVDTMPAPIR